MAKKTIKHIEVKGKRVLVRVDFNVPLNEDREITDDRRIKGALPTIKYLLENNAGKIILMSHLGRPKGKIREELRLTPVARRLSDLLGGPVLKLDDCVGEEIKKAISESKEKVILLENLRFHPEEEKNDPEFAKELASLGDIYVSDAFGTVHRAHASTVGVAKYLPAVAGFLIERELKYLGGALESPQRPFAAILGGAKVSDKITVIENLLNKVDMLIIGGGMAYTFLKAQGKEIGNSKLEADRVSLAGDLIKKAQEKGVDLFLPVDSIAASEFKEGAEFEIVEDVPEGKMGLDIGPKTVELFCGALSKAKTIVWNGPLGVFEMPPFDEGSRKVSECIAALDVIKVIGGGDTAAMISKFGLEDKMTHISTGGGASLEFLEGKSLPGIEVLEDV